MLSLLLLCLIVCISALLWHLKKRNGCFKAMGIAGPEPMLLFGSLLSFSGKMMHEALMQWTATYGKVFGYYEGGTPILVISDLDMLHEIFVKKFSHFHSRKALPVGPDPDKAKDVHMFMARGQRWKRLRSTCNPTFSSSKLKAMTPTMDDAVSLFMSLLQEQCRAQKPFDIYPMYQALTLDVIGRCAFGLQVDCQTNPRDEFLILCKQVFLNTTKLNWIRMGGLLFPECPRVWMALSNFRDTIAGGNPFVDLKKKLLNVTDQRRSISANKAIDLLGLLLEAEVGDDQQFEIEGDQYRSYNKDVDGQSKPSRKLLPQEIVSTGVLFLLAGYETTSVLLAYATYLLACNQHVQEKVASEIDEVYNEESVYEALSKCVYLDYVISETLRLYPVATTIQARKCMEDCVVGDILIPRGLTVAADLWTIHYSKQIWGEDADAFRPERFSPEESDGRHPMAWLPFGAGPRNCIGMRFALMEAKLTLFKVLKRFSFETCPETEVPLKLQEGATTTPSKGITIVCRERIG